MPQKRLNLILASICGELLCTCVLLPSFSSAQCTCVTGTVSDQHEKTPLYNSVISIINPTDSVLTRFARADTKGRFTITLPATGNYTMMVSYPGYADFIDTFTALRDSAVHAGEIKLIKKAELLEAVIVKQQLGAIRIKGDTIEYKADSFLMKKGATVSDLLKRLPGIQVDRNGTITAQGQKVNKVLVDGEEFFSDDPAIVTQNLQADYINNVQVFDKKSDQAEFTGIDDGQRSRTINLTLKPEKKKGYFGKINAGGGTQGKFDNNVMLNSFKGSRKFSAFGIMSNNDHNQLNWEERGKLGTRGDVEYDEENGYFMMNNNIDDDFSREINSDEGLPTTWSGGIHYSDAWKEKQKISGDYRFMKRNLSSSSTTTTQFILPDTQYFNTQSRNAFSTRIRNSLGGVYDLKIDSATSVKFTVGAGRMNAKTESYYTGRALNADSAVVNANIRTLNSDVIKDNYSIAGLLRRKFKKKGRTLSVSLTDYYNGETLDGSLVSHTDYFSRLGGQSQEVINQKKMNDSRASSLSANIVYTEPLSTKVFLSFNYGLNSNSSTVHRNTYNKDISDESYKLRDSIYSNDFKYNYLIHSAGADIKINTKKVTYTIGAAGNYANFNQRDLVKDSASKYSFFNFFPKTFIRYNFSPQRQLTFRYSGGTQPPQPEQLQPVRQNNDPLNVQLGNPSLRQEFRNNVSANFYDYKVLTERYIYAYTSASTVRNAIGTSADIDSVGKTTYRFINLNGSRSGNINFGYYTKSKKLQTYFSFGGSADLSRVVNQLNGLTNVNDNQNYMVRLSAEKHADKKYSVELRPGFGYTFSRSSLRPDVVTKYFTTESAISAWVQLPWKLSALSNVYINTRQKTQVFNVNQNVTKWDASISKKIGKNEKSELTFSVNDILNQNVGFNRTATSNFISQNTYSTLRRFAMLNFVYNISKNP